MLKPESRGFETSRDLAVRRLTASWIEAQMTWCFIPAPRKWLRQWHDIAPVMSHYCKPFSQWQHSFHESCAAIGLNACNSIPWLWYHHSLSVLPGKVHCHIYNNKPWCLEASPTGIMAIGCCTPCQCCVRLIIAAAIMATNHGTLTAPTCSRYPMRMLPPLLTICGVNRFLRLINIIPNITAWHGVSTWSLTAQQHCTNFENGENN